VRIPFRWERVQPTLYKPFDPAEFAQLRAAVHRARNAGLLPILDMHNFGGYYMVRGNPARAPRQDLGSTTLPIKAFVDFWRRMSAAFRHDRSVFGYDLMNEPTSTRNPVPPPSETARPLLGDPKTWERASQAALNAIRANGDRRVILVGGFGWSGVGYWPTAHARPWIRDPANNFLYEAHQFFDCRVGGQYNSTYDDELQCAKDAGWKP
jgi:endoglucanase